MRSADVLVVPVLLPAVLAAATAEANDGANRYRPPVPPTLVHFPAPASPAAGYRLLAADGPDGSDGDPAFRWAAPHAVAAVRLAAHETVVALGPAAHAPAVFDLSAENADTPVQWSPTPPRGRHPGGSHDGGLNLDLGYPLVSLAGRDDTPDHAACTDHHGPDGQDAHRCRGPADRLDADRAAHLLLRLFRLSRDRFDGDLLEEVGIDAAVRDTVLGRVRGWVPDGRHGADAAVLGDMERTLTCDPWEGWAAYHHHHVHLRFRDLATYGRHRAAVDELLARERAVDAALLGGRPGVPALRARLVSTGMAREVEAEFLPPPAPGTAVRYRVDRGKWHEADPSDPRLRAMIDLGSGPVPAGREVLVEAELGAGPSVGRATARLPIPPADPRMFVAVDPSRIVAEARREAAGAWSLALRVPEPYRAYVTSVSWEVSRAGGATETIADAREEFAARVADGEGPERIVLVRAVVVLSGRLKVRLTAACPTT
jgi:hypothetical protein